MSKKLTPDAARIAACRSGRAEGHVQVEVTLENHTDSPLFVVDRVRRMELDEASCVLHLWFSDRGREPDRAGSLRREFSAPKSRAVEAGRDTVLRASVPASLTRLVVHDDDSFHLEALDLSQALEVVVHLAVGTTPFYFRPAEGELAAQSSRWGTEVTAKAAIDTEGQLSPRTKGDEPDYKD